MEKYPKFIFDSKRIRESRKKIQRKIGDEDFYSSFSCRPFTIYISHFLVKYTTVKANPITFVMAFLSVLAPILLYFVNTPVLFIALTLFAYLFILFLDVLDGEVARLRNETSELGKYIDSVLWYTLGALSVVFLLKLNSFYFQYEFLPPLIIVLYFLKLFAIVSWAQYIVPTLKVESKKLNYHFYVRAFVERPSFYLYFLIIALIGKYTQIDIILIMKLLFVLIFSIDIVVSFKKIKGVIKYLKGS